MLFLPLILLPLVSATTFFNVPVGNTTLTIPLSYPPTNYILVSDKPCSNIAINVAANITTSQSAQYVSCIISFDYLWEIFNIPQNFTITFTDPTYIIQLEPWGMYTLLLTPSSIGKAILKDIDIAIIDGTNTFQVTTYMQRNPYTSPNCQIPTEIAVEVGSCTTNATLVDTTGSISTYHSNITRNTLLTCDGQFGTTNNGTIQYNFTVTAKEELQWPSTGKQWIDGDNECDALRPYTEVGRDSQKAILNVYTYPISSDRTGDVKRSLFMIDTDSLRMDTEKCTGQYVTLASSLAFTLLVYFPTNSYIVNLLLADNPTLGYNIPLEQVGEFSCSGTLCSVDVRTVDCLPVYGNDTCTFQMDDLYSYIYIERIYEFDGIRIEDYSLPVNNILQTESFVSQTCPTLSNAYEFVSDVFPTTITYRGGEALSSEMAVSIALEDLENNTHFSIEILDVTITMFDDYNKFFTSEIITKRNKLLDKYPTDAHFCRYNSGDPNDRICRPYYEPDTSRAEPSLLNQYGLYPACDDEKVARGNNNDRNYDVFAFTPDRWKFGAFQGTNCHFDISIIAAIRNCDLNDTTFQRSLQTSSVQLVQNFLTNVTIQITFNITITEFFLTMPFFAAYGTIFFVGLVYHEIFERKQL